MTVCSLEFFIKVSLTIITLISFLCMSINYYLDRKRYLGLWAIGLGLFFVNYTLLIFNSYGNHYKIIQFLQMAIYMFGSIFLVEGSAYLLDKKPIKHHKMTICIGIFMLMLYEVDIFSNRIVLLGYFGFLCYINLSIASRFYKTEKFSIYNKNFISVLYFAMATVDISDYIFFTYHNDFLIDLFSMAFILIIFHYYSFFIYYKGKIKLGYEKEICFDDTFNNSNIGMCLVDKNLTITRTNKAFCEMLGYKESELLNKKIGDISHPDDNKQEAAKAKKRIDENRNSFQIEKRYVHKSGSIVWTMLTVSIIRDKQGSHLYYIGQVQDITSYKDINNQLAISNEKYETLLNCYDNSIAVLDREFRFVIANKYAVNKINEHTGLKYTTSSIIGHRITDVCPDIEQTESFKTYEYVMNSGKPMEITLNYINPKGEDNWYEINVTPSQEGILVITKNVTDRVESQKTIVENETKYRGLVEQCLDGIVLADKDGYIIEFNHEMERITGISKEEAINKNVVDMYIELGGSEFHNSSSADNIKKYFERDHIVGNTVNSSRTYSGEVRRKDGTSIDVEEFYYPIITENSKMVCFTFRDITELKKLERIKERVEENERLIKETIELDKLRSEFFANLSHEFRTPLNIILSSNKMIQQLMESFQEDSRYAVKQQKIFKYLKSSKQNCYRLLRLINNIIDITKIDAGFFHSNFQCLNIVSVVEEISQSIADYAKNKGISIIFDTDIEEKNTMCDADAIERIILNLLSNAIKFTENGGNIEVALKDMNSYIEIAVKDSGIGIPKEQLPLIFNRFKQVDKSLTRRQEGSGIGLSLVKSLVEMHGGTIEVFSKVGIGTKFVIKLPTKIYCSIDETAAAKEFYESKVEKVNIEFSDIYF